MNRNEVIKGLIDSGNLNYELFLVAMAAIYSQALVDMDEGLVIVTPEQIMTRVESHLEQALHTGPAPL